MHSSRSQSARCSSSSLLPSISVPSLSLMLNSPEHVKVSVLERKKGPWAAAGRKSSAPAAALANCQTASNTPSEIQIRKGRSCQTASAHLELGAVCLHIWKSNLRSMLSKRFVLRTFFSFPTEDVPQVQRHSEQAGVHWSSTME